MDAWSWQPELPPAVRSFAIGSGSAPAVNSWEAAEQPAMECIAVPLLVEAPKAMSLLVRKTPIKTFSFLFDPGIPSSFLSAAKPKGTNAAAEIGEAVQKPTVTRIKPPGDVVKLEDRLHYLLQPPLETVLSNEALHFPFQPFPYQMQGIAFMYPRYAAILADEMGLGKTMQAITAIRLLLHAGEARKILLVCPKPLVTNWQREFATWAPEVPLMVIEGDQAKRNWQWQLPEAPLKIANYELLMRDKDVIADPNLKFDLVVLDEAQRIKNKNSTTSQIVRSLHRSRSWALTGTPIENSPEDLVGIFEFLSPGYLNREMNARSLGQAVRDYIIRRTKDMVLTDLPPKMFRDAELELTPNQRTRYEMAENEGIMKLNQMGEDITIQNVFELVLRLKQICNFDPVTGDSAKLERLEADMEEVAASGCKAIVFSQWVQSIDQMRLPLARFRPLEYHGRIPSNKRDAVLKEFKEDPKRHVLVMSYGAGSVGLNLQFCRYVFLFDRWWNPAIEDQAINRAHRIGAAGSVTVTRFLTVNSVEERINQVLEEKRELFDTIFSQTGAPRSQGLSQSDVFGLFNLKVRTPKGPVDLAA